VTPRSSSANEQYSVLLMGFGKVLKITVYELID
jgi:hypothetical protein